MGTVVVIILLPLALGMGGRHFATRLALKLERGFRVFGVVFLAMLIVLIVHSESGHFLAALSVIGLAVILHNMSAFTLGYWIPRLLKAGKRPGPHRGHGGGPAEHHPGHDPGGAVLFAQGGHPRGYLQPLDDLRWQHICVPLVPKRSQTSAESGENCRVTWRVKLLSPLIDLCSVAPLEHFPVSQEYVKGNGSNQSRDRKYDWQTFWVLTQHLRFQVCGPEPQICMKGGRAMRLLDMLFHVFAILGVF